ncbi:MAG: anaphase promoting complex subunit doc1 [Geoglossum umbratile]|nr:MAG: anaphase promoting complex subunit doc1 [Geoglossum umbratile]
MPRARPAPPPREEPTQTLNPAALPSTRSSFSSTEGLVSASNDDDDDDDGGGGEDEEGGGGATTTGLPRTHAWFAKRDGTANSAGEDDKGAEFSAAGLKEIGNLASWTVSTAKPGCGVEALRDEDVNLFWQSDGPQPHLLNIHFFKRVSIVAIRLYLDWENDESYTPTKMSLLAGTGYHDLVEFVELAFEQPRGWINIDLSGVGGAADGAASVRGRGAGAAGAVLRAWLVQVRVSENHQNGKDTHVRGLQIFAREEGDPAGDGEVGEEWEWGGVGLGGEEDLR